MDQGLSSVPPSPNTNAARIPPGPNSPFYSFPAFLCVTCVFALWVSFGPLCRFVTKNDQEKCVDIALAVEMLHMSTVRDAFDIAVIVTGQRWFAVYTHKIEM